MPTIPTYNATVSTGAISQPRAQAQRGIAQSLSNLGGVSQQIGNTLAEIKDRSDMVESQVFFQSQVAKASDEFKNDTDFTTIRERYNDRISYAMEQSLEGLSNNAKRTLAPQLKLATQAENVRFNSLAFQREGNVKIANLEKNKPIIYNQMVNARTPEELEQGISAAENAVQSVVPYYEVGKAEQFVTKFMREGFYQRGIREVEELARSGKNFDGEVYSKTLLPDQILKLESHFNATRNNNKAQVKSNFNTEFNNGKTIGLATGDFTVLHALENQSRAAGLTDLANSIAQKTEYLSVFYEVKSEIMAKNPQTSLEQVRADALSDPRIAITGDTEEAYFAAGVRNQMNAFIDDQIRIRDKDPAAYAQASLPKIENETPEQNAIRRADRERVQSGNPNLVATVLTKQENAVYKQGLTSAIQNGNTDQLEAVLNSISGYGAFEHKVMRELEVDPAMSIALDAYKEGNSTLMAKVAGLVNIKKAKDINPEYDRGANESTVLQNDFVKLLLRQNRINPLNDDGDYISGIIDLGHKILASGGTLDEYFGGYPAIDSDHALAILPVGVNANLFRAGSSELVSTVLDFSDYVPDTNPDKKQIIAEMKKTAVVVNADPTDTRIPKGERGYYIQKVTGALAIHKDTKEKLLVLESDVMNARFKSEAIATFR